MDDFLTRASIWLALTLFVAAQVARGGSAATAVIGSRLFWTGWVAFVGHIALAFQSHYGWSHAVALAHTAAQTAAATGVETGSGLYLNYLFGVLWLVEAWWWHRHGVSVAARQTSLELAVRVFWLFMIVNGAVIFVGGPQRWFGLTLVALLLYAWRPGTLAFGWPTNRP
ncbi:MAG: hypothetical protein O3A25_03805 [Acidobacteria bacterium]|nr:hypothetical protein [Acidobacteriota bacterium]